MTEDKDKKDEVSLADLAKGLNDLAAKVRRMSDNWKKFCVSRIGEQEHDDGKLNGSVRLAWAMILLLFFAGFAAAAITIMQYTDGATTADTVIYSLQSDGDNTATLVITGSVAVSETITAAGAITAGGALDVDSITVDAGAGIDNQSAGTLVVGASTATNVVIADTAVTTIIEGPIQAREDIQSDEIDAENAATLLIGKATATKVEIADAAIETEIQGTVDAHQTVALVSNMTVACTVDSTTKDTGCIVVEGGIGIEKALFVGSATASSSKDTGAIICQGGIGTEEDIYAGGNIEAVGTITAANIVTTTTSVSGNWNVGGTLEAQGASTFTGTVTCVTNATVNGNLTAGSDLTVEESLTVADNVNVLSGTTSVSNLTAWAAIVGGFASQTLINDADAQLAVSNVTLTALGTLAGAGIGQTLINDPDAILSVSNITLNTSGTIAGTAIGQRIINDADAQVTVSNVTLSTAGTLSAPLGSATVSNLTAWGAVDTKAGAVNIGGTLEVQGTTTLTGALTTVSSVTVGGYFADAITAYDLTTGPAGYVVTAATSLVTIEMTGTGYVTMLAPTAAGQHVDVINTSSGDTGTWVEASSALALGGSPFWLARSNAFHAVAVSAGTWVVTDKP